MLTHRCIVIVMDTPSTVSNSHFNTPPPYDSLEQMFKKEKYKISKREHKNLNQTERTIDK